jgi:hypothetical protein
MDDVGGEISAPMADSPVKQLRLLRNDVVPDIGWQLTANRELLLLLQM